MSIMNENYEILLNDLGYLAESWSERSTSLRINAETKTPEVFLAKADTYEECSAELLVTLLGYTK